jgi:hypothetical protein
MSVELFYHVPVTAGGASYDLSRDLTSFTIEEDEQMADVLKIHVTDRNKVLSHAFQEGMDVEVDLGMTDDHSLVFRGRIYKVDADMPEDGVPRLVIHAHDNSMKMGLLKRKRAWQDKTLKEIVTEIAADPKYSFKRRRSNCAGIPVSTGTASGRITRPTWSSCWNLRRIMGPSCTSQPMTRATTSTFCRSTT